jgi:multidrug efflux pump subunit AcrB
VEILEGLCAGRPLVVTGTAAIFDGAVAHREGAAVSLASISIKRPVFAWMLMIAPDRLRRHRLHASRREPVPGRRPARGQHHALLPGAAPEVMESDVVDPVESAVIQVEGLVQMSSTCRQSSANIKLEFELNRDIDAAIQDVQTRLAQVQRLLPKGHGSDRGAEVEPGGHADPLDRRLGHAPLLDISEYIRNTLKDQFQTIPGVGDISMSGYRERNVRVWLDSKLLQSYDLTVDDVMSALSREHVELPAGGSRRPTGSSTSAPRARRSASRASAISSSPTAPGLRSCCATWRSSRTAWRTSGASRG